MSTAPRRAPQASKWSQILRQIVPIAVVILVVITTRGCSSRSTTTGGRADQGQRYERVFKVAAGSENEAVFFRGKDADGKPIDADFIREFEDANHVSLSVTLMGSVDIMRQAELGTNSDYDALFAASSVWLQLGNERGHALKDIRSVYQSPVVFAVLKSTAERTGWLKDGHPQTLTVDGILKAAEKGDVHFAMTTPTRSNSGNAAYMSFLYAFAGHPDVLTEDAIRSADVTNKIRRILRAQFRKSGSSGWLKNLYVEQAERGTQPFNAMFNYESLVIEANTELVAHGLEPFIVFYVQDGLAIADSPLGYVDKGDAAKKAEFDALQAKLLSPAVQRELVGLGRRPAATLQPDPAQVDRNVWNPAWGIDVQRILSPFPMPEAPVIRAAMEQYGLALRPPVLQILVLDYSGSMGRNGGFEQLTQACDALLDPDKSRQNLLFIGPHDKTVVIPFDGTPRNEATLADWTVNGNDPDALRRLDRRIAEEQPGGDTDMYAAVLLAFRVIRDLGASARDYKASIVVMSAGMSNKGPDLEWLGSQLGTFGAGGDTPVYTMLFGEASTTQMDPLARRFSGRMFDGRKDFVGTFQEVLSYNQ